jgi:uncharacterized protein YrrD
MTCFQPYVAATALALLSLASPASAQTAATTPTFITQQPAGQALASMFKGQDVTNAAGEKLGDIGDLLFDTSGRITGAVVGVGGLLGLGEKYVAVPFDALTITTGGKGERIVMIGLTKESLKDAPEFKPTEKTTFMKAKEKAGELIDQAGKKIDDMRKDDQKKP